MNSTCCTLLLFASLLDNDMAIMYYYFYHVQNLVNLYTQVVSERPERFYKTLELTQAAVGSDSNYVTGLSVVSLANRFELPIVSSRNQQSVVIKKGIYKLVT